MEDGVSSRLRSQMGFLLAADGLKGVSHANLIADGSRHENSAGHSWHVALMAMVLAEHSGQSLDLGRVLGLLTIHDLVEVYAGDTLIYDEEAVRGQADRESEAARRIFGFLPSGQRENLYRLWREFEERSTPEAVYARAIDALAPTWIHWGEHANHPNTGLRASQVLARKKPRLEPFPVLLEFLEGLVASAVDRGPLEP